MQYLLRFALIALVALTPMTVRAQSVGAACTPNGAAAWVAGVPLVCSSLVWAVDTIRIGTSSATCNSGIQGTLRMSGTTLQYCNGTAWTALGGTAGTYAVDRQTFNSSSTWTKPSSGNYTLIECWGGGGSGGKSAATTHCGGGGGGGYNWRFIPTSSLGATETVTIGAGGTAVTVTNTAGNAGGNTTFGSWVTAYGGTGSGSTFTYGGSGGGQLSSGVAGVSGGEPYIWSDAVNGWMMGLTATTADSLFLGGAGGYSTSIAGDESVWGGGGGGNGCSAVNGTGTAGGTSTNGGAGGAGGNGTTSGTAGTQPGGGGGGTWNGTSSGAGGAGRCIVTTF